MRGRRWLVVWLGAATLAVVGAFYSSVDDALCFGTCPDPDARLAARAALLGVGVVACILATRATSRWARLAALLPFAALVVELPVRAALDNA